MQVHPEIDPRQAAVRLNDFLRYAPHLAPFVRPAPDRVVPVDASVLRSVQVG